MHVYSRMPAPRRAVNLRIDGELLRQARVLKLNLSQVLDQALRKQVKDARREAWFTSSRVSHRRLQPPRPPVRRSSPAGCRRFTAGRSP